MGHDLLRNKGVQKFLPHLADFISIMHKTKWYDGFFKDDKTSLQASLFPCYHGLPLI